MTTTTKVLLGLGAAGVVAFVLLRRRKGKVVFGELTTVRDADGCGCFFVEQLADGTVRSTRVARARCEAEPNLRKELEQCGAQQSNAAFETLLAISDFFTLDNADFFTLGNLFHADS